MRTLILALLMTGCVTVPKAVEVETPEKQCPPTKLVGWTSEAEMTPMDMRTYKDVKLSGCKRIFKGRLNCLTTFIKRGFQNYRALCGGYPGE